MTISTVQDQKKEIDIRTVHQDSGDIIIAYSPWTKMTFPRDRTDRKSQGIPGVSFHISRLRDAAYNGCGKKTARALVKPLQRSQPGCGTRDSVVLSPRRAEQSSDQADLKLWSVEMIWGTPGRKVEQLLEEVWWASIQEEAEPNPKWAGPRSVEKGKVEKCPSRKWSSSSRRKETWIGRKVETSSSNCIDM